VVRLTAEPQTNASGGTSTIDRIEAQCTAGPQRLVQRLPRGARCLGDIGHATSARDVTQRSGKQSRVVGLQNVSQARSNRLVAVEVWSGNKCRKRVNLDALFPLRFLSQSRRHAHEWFKRTARGAAAENR
jgi:hypothetical protein